MNVQDWTFAVQLARSSTAHTHGVPHRGGRSTPEARTECTERRSATRVGRLGRDARSRRPTRSGLRGWLCLMLGVPLLTACGASGPADVTLAELAARPQAYDGRDVRTRGTVRVFDAPRHYWLEDAQLNRVGLEPMERIAPHLGREVTVTGRFSYARERGRRIAISSIEPFDAPR